MADSLFGTGAQIAPIRQTPIQPTGIPGSTYVRPQEYQKGSNLRALADALGSLNGALQNYANVTKRNEEDPAARDNREWIARREQMGIEDLRNEAVNGTPDGIRVREDALNALLGERANDDFRRAWMEFYNGEFDRTTGDAAGEYERMRKEYAEGLPSEIAKGNFYRLTGDHFRSWMEKDTEEKVTYAMQEVQTTVVDSFRNTIDDALGIHKLDPKKAAEIVFAKSASNRDFLGLSGQQQNETIFAIAEEYALKGDEGMARALLEGTRTGADGKTLPPLIKIAGYTDKGLKLLEQAGAMRDKKVKEDGLNEFINDDELVATGAFTPKEAAARKGSGLYSDSQLAGMVNQSNNNRAAIERKSATEHERRMNIRNSELEEQGVFAQAYNAMGKLGGVNKVHDVEVVHPSGEGTKTLTKKEIVGEVTSMFESDMEARTQELIDGGKSPGEAKAIADRMRIDWYAGNKLDNDQWSNTLNGIAGRASTDTLLQKGEVSKYMAESAELYRTLKAINPAYLSTQLSDKASKEFLETYDNAVTNRRMTTEDALTYAASMSARDDRTKARSMVKADVADKMARTTLRKLGLDDRSSNLAYVTDQIAQMSAWDFTEREIKEKLESAILDTAVPINGMLVFDHNDLPDDFPELVELELKDRVEVFGKSYGITDPSDLFITAEAGESKWLVWSKTLQMPVGASFITPSSLNARRTRAGMDRDEMLGKLATAKDADRAKYKAQYDEDISYAKERVRYWNDLASQRKGVRGSFASKIAKKLQENLDARMSNDEGFFTKTINNARSQIESTKDADTKRNRELMEFYRSFIPSVKIGGKTLIE